jgi:hypothetical protein
MKTLVVYLRMYDPDKRTAWLKPHTLRFNSAAELKAEISKLKARYQRWTGDEPHV